MLFSWFVFLTLFWFLFKYFIYWYTLFSYYFLIFILSRFLYYIFELLLIFHLFVHFISILYFFLNHFLYRFLCLVPGRRSASLRPRTATKSSAGASRVWRPHSSRRPFERPLSPVVRFPFKYLRFPFKCFRFHLNIYVFHSNVSVSV